MQETEAESFEVRLKIKESEALKAAEEGIEIRLEEQATNLAIKEKELGEQVRLVRDLGDQLTAMEHKRDEALAAAKAEYHTEIQRMRLLTSKAVAEKAEFFGDMQRIKQANSKGIEELEAMKHERDEAASTRINNSYNGHTNISSSTSNIMIFIHVQTTEKLFNSLQCFNHNSCGLRHSLCIFYGRSN